MTKYLYLSVNVPEESADIVREAMGNAGAGKIGNYSHTSFSIKGIGRSKAHTGAQPTIGEVGEYTAMTEEKVETTCRSEELETIITAIKEVHPYEEPVIITYPIDLVD